MGDAHWRIARSMQMLDFLTDRENSTFSLKVLVSEIRIDKNSTKCTY